MSEHDHDPRVLKHVDALAQAGTDFEAFLNALDALKADRNLPGPQRKAVLKTLAQDQAIQYIAAVTGKSPRPVRSEED